MIEDKCILLNFVVIWFLYLFYFLYVYKLI